MKFNEVKELIKQQECEDTWNPDIMAKVCDYARLSDEWKNADKCGTPLEKTYNEAVERITSTYIVDAEHYDDYGLTGDRELTFVKFDEILALYHEWYELCEETNMEFEEFFNTFEKVSFEDYKLLLHSLRECYDSSCRQVSSWRAVGNQDMVKITYDRIRSINETIAAIENLKK